MSTCAILPVKGFEAAKQRLSAELSPGPRRALAEAMYADVLTALRRCPAIGQVIVVSSDHSAQRLAGGHGATVLDERGAGHSRAALVGIAHALEQRIGRALLVPGDCPLLDPHEVAELLGSRPEGERLVTIVPDRHGTGTNALLLSPPGALEPAFGPDSRQRHAAAAEAAGIPHEIVAVPTLALDVDTPDDLAALRGELARRHGGAAHTRGMLSQLRRSQAP